MTASTIIFDFDGTLGDTRRNIVVTMQDVMRELNLPLQDEHVCASTIGLPLKGCYAQMFPQLNADELDRCAEVHRRCFTENLKKITPMPFPQVKETLEVLRNHGICLAIASSRTSESLRDLLGRMGIDSLFSCIIGAQDIVHAKPDAEPVLKILDILGFMADETLVVGDMDVDILMGANAGTKTCGVTWGNGTREALGSAALHRKELNEAGADFIIDRMEELIDILYTKEKQ